MVHFEQTQELARVIAYTRIHGTYIPNGNVYEFKGIPEYVINDMRVMDIEPVEDNNKYYVHLDAEARRLPQWMATMNQERAMDLCTFIIKHRKPNLIVTVDEQPIWLALFNTIDYEIRFKNAVYFHPVGKRARVSGIDP